MGRERLLQALEMVEGFRGLAGGGGDRFFFATWASTSVGGDEVARDNTCWPWMTVESGWAGRDGRVDGVDEEKGRRWEEGE